ncbi:hypothetical protein BJX76DRAFT_362672 [Aspergillus varians]
MSTMSAKVLLPLLGLSVLYSFYLLEANGTNKLILDLIADKKLHDSNTPLRTVYTGIAPLDEALTYLVVFLWPITNGDNPALILHTTSLFGGVNAAWTVLLLEGYRTGHTGTIVAFPIIFGLLSQFLTFAVSLSIYCTLHLFTSPTAQNPTRQNLSVPRAVTTTLPVAILIGYIIPAGILLAPVSDNVTQVFLAAWQPWPAYASLTILLAHTLFPTPTTENATATSKKAIWPLRLLYAVTFLTTAIPHVVSWALPLLEFTTSTLSNADTLFSVRPVDVYPLPWTTSVGSIAEGVHAFLTYNYLITSLSLLVWAGTLHSRVSGGVGYGRVAALVVLVGPVAVAVGGLWEREEMVVGGSSLSIFSSSSQSVLKVASRPRGGSGMGKWERGGKVLRFDD